MKALYSLVGMRHRGPEIEKLVKRLPLGAVLELRRDRENRFDYNAIEVWTTGESPTHIGFVSSKQNRGLAQRMDAGEKDRMPAVLKAAGGWPNVEVEE